MPTVSVVVPNYNHARFLCERLDSIYNQSFRDFEVILLDDASTDDSLSILSEYASRPDTRLIVNECNSGSPFAQWNKGVKLARGGYVWIAESDDWADPHLLQALAHWLDTCVNAGIAYCRSHQVDEFGEVLGFKDEDYRNLAPGRWGRDFTNSGLDECRRFMLQKNVIANASAVLFRKDVYVRSGMADESFRLCGDWFAWVRMLSLSDVAYCSKPLNYFRTHPCSRRSTSLAVELLIEHYRIIEYIATRQSPPKKLLRHVLGEKYREYTRIVKTESVDPRTYASLSGIAREVDKFWRVRQFSRAVKYVTDRVGWRLSGLSRKMRSKSSNLP